MPVQIMTQVKVGLKKKKQQLAAPPQPKAPHQTPSCHVAGPSSLKAPYLTPEVPTKGKHWEVPWRPRMSSDTLSMLFLQQRMPPPLQPLCLAQAPHHLGLTLPSSQWSVCLLGGSPLRAGMQDFHQHLSGALCSVYLEQSRH